MKTEKRTRSWLMRQMPPDHDARRAVVHSFWLRNGVTYRYRVLRHFEFEDRHGEHIILTSIAEIEPYDAVPERSA